VFAIAPDRRVDMMDKDPSRLLPGGSKLCSIINQNGPWNRTFFIFELGPTRNDIDAIPIRSLVPHVLP